MRLPSKAWPRTADTLIFSLFGRSVQECLPASIDVQFQLLTWHQRFHQGLFMSINTRGWGYNGATAHTATQRLVHCPLFVFRLDQAEESNPLRGWGVRPWPELEPDRAVAGAAVCRCSACLAARQNSGLSDIAENAASIAYPLAHGFLRLHCDDCGFDRLVAGAREGMD